MTNLWRMKTRLNKMEQESIEHKLWWSWGIKKGTLLQYMRTTKLSGIMIWLEWYTSITKLAQEAMAPECLHLIQFQSQLLFHRLQQLHLIQQLFLFLLVPSKQAKLYLSSYQKCHKSRTTYSQTLKRPPKRTETSTFVSLFKYPSQILSEATKSIAW